MKEEKTGSKRKVIYYVILGVCAALLITGIVLTVYFVTQGTQPVVEDPPVNDPIKPDGPGSDKPDEPVSGDVVTFVSPIDVDVTTSFYEMFENVTMNYWYYYHEGVDYAAEEGAEVKAIADGTVSYLDNDEYLGYEIRVTHADGFESRYLFAQPVEGLKKGDTVKQGQVIATVAAEEGNEKFLGSHLHFELLKNDAQVDPAAYLDVVLEEK